MTKYFVSTILSALLIFILSGCSSSYIVSEKSKSLLRSIDNSSARNLLLQRLKKSDNGGGFCIGGLKMRSDYKNHNSLKLDAKGNLSFVASYVEKTTITGFHFIGISNVTMDTKEDWAVGEFSVNLNKVKTIRVKDTSGSFTSTFCEGLIPGKLVIVQGDNGLGFFINVTENEIDNVIAGLLYFAKNADLKEGLGF
jgi:hypothetical protein